MVRQFITLAAVVLKGAISTPTKVGGMPGDWHRRGRDLDVKVGSLLEGAVTDDEGRPQGTIVLGVKAIGKEHQGHPTVEAAFCAENPLEHVDRPEEKGAWSTCQK